MKRYNVSGYNSFARFAVRPHQLRSTHVYRGGVRR